MEAAPPVFGPARAPAVASDLLRSRDAVLSVLVAVVLPLLLQAAGLSGLNRFAYPVTVLAAAWHLWSKRSPWYVGLVILTFSCCPLVRRLHDHVAGFDQYSPILLAPYLACAWSSLSALDLLVRGRARGAAPFLLFIACVCYGAVVATLDGRFLPAVVDLLKWASGPFVALHVLAAARQGPAIHRVVEAVFLVATPLMALYGVAQFAAPQPWDIAWSREMIQLGTYSMGRPEPFELRVYGTMHSPGSFAAYLMMGVVFLLSSGGAVGLPLVVVVLLGVGLAQYRMLWAVTLVGMVVVAVFGARAQRLRVVAGAGLVVLCAGSLATIPELERTLSERFRSIGELGADASGEDRLGQYLRFLVEEDSLILGQGLGSNGAARRAPGSSIPVLDSAILETYAALGVYGGSLCLLCLMYVGVRMLRVGRASSPHFHIYRFVALATLLQLPFGSVHIGEAGFVFWVFAGLCAALPVEGPVSRERPPPAAV